ncbi:MAG: hypothetical protein AB7H80_00930 [Candidatus Kapaibacterium sp.]
MNNHTNDNLVFTMRSLLLLLLFVGTYQNSSAQIYPVRTDVQINGLKGDVLSTTTTSRAYSPATERWEPLQITVVNVFNKGGNLLLRKTYLQQATSTTSLFTYDKKADSLKPVFEVSAAGSIRDKDSGRVILDETFTYMPDGKLKARVERNFQSGKTTRYLYFYVNSRLEYLVEQDSATDAFTSIEKFFYMKGDKPQGSTIRHYNPATDLIRSLKDTAGVPESRIQYDYTSYVYGDTTTPVIFWRWNYGNDTIVDRQEIKRFLENGNHAATITQEFKDGKNISSRSQIFNEYGDPISVADSFGNDTTYQRGFDYIYDERDEYGNWKTKRQYVAADPQDKESEHRLLLYRTDRTIKYFDEE